MLLQDTNILHMCLTFLDCCCGGIISGSTCAVDLLSAVTGAAEGKELLGKLWQDIMPEAVHFVRKHLKEPVTTVDNALVASCFSIMDALLKPYVRCTLSTAMPGATCA